MWYCKKQPLLHRFTPQRLHPNVVSGVRPEEVLCPWLEQLMHALFLPENFTSWCPGRLGRATAMGVLFLFWPGYLFLPQKPPMSCLARSSLKWRRERCLGDGWRGERRSKIIAFQNQGVPISLRWWSQHHKIISYMEVPQCSSLHCFIQGSWWTKKGKIASVTQLILASIFFLSEITIGGRQ